MTTYKYTDSTNTIVHVIDDDGVSRMSGMVSIVPDGAVILPADPLPAPDYSALRAQAYRDESDPLFFKEQRGEVPVGTWLAKVEEIKARRPE